MHAKVIIFWQQRKKIILERSDDLAKSVNGRLVMQSNLLDEVTDFIMPFSFSVFFFQ